MQIKVYIIPLLDSFSSNEELNKFLRSHKIVDIRQEFVDNQSGAYWTYSISYLQSSNLKNHVVKKEKIDYKKVLKKSEFEIFEKLRELRKEISRKEAIPAYAVFTDAELAKIGKLQVINYKTIMSINGIGVKKTEKYGKLIVEMLNKK